jgi:hypothetical protein
VKNPALFVSFVLLVIVLIALVLAIIYGPVAFLGYHLGKSKAEQELLRRKLYGRTTN